MAILEKYSKRAAAGLLLLFFAALVFMGCVFPIIQNATIAEPATVTIVPSGQTNPAIKVYGAQYDIAGDELKLEMSKSPDRARWQISGQWLHQIKIEASYDQLKKIQTVEVKLGQKSFIFNSPELLSRWSIAKDPKNASQQILASPSGLRSGTSKIGRFNAYINWPGDRRFVLDALVRTAVTLAIVAAVIALLLLFNRWFLKNELSFLSIKKFFGQHPNVWLAVVIVIGVALRMPWAVSKPFFDFDSHIIIAQIVNHGGNVYAETNRYNYGPPWFYIIGFLYKIVRGNPAAYRWALAVFATLADLGIFAVLLKKFGKLAAAVFFLNPLSIVISGYGVVFDNFAVLSGLVAMLIYGNDGSAGITKRKFWGLVALGLSLSIKHLFIALPLWLAYKQRGVKQKLVTLVLPPLLFLAGFLPFWRVGRQGIINNVFLYHSLGGTPTLRFFKLLMGEVHGGQVALLLFLAALIIFGYVLRRLDNITLVLLYTLVMLTFTSSISLNYLVIPAAAAAAYLNIFFVFYFVTAYWLAALDLIQTSVPDKYMFSSWIIPGLFFLLGVILVFDSFWPEKFKKFKPAALNHLSL